MTKNSNEERQAFAASTAIGPGLTVGIDDKVGIPKATLLGVQHVLAMDLYVFPLLLAGIIGLEFADTTFLISMCFFVCGIGTIIQTQLLVRIPIVQGASYICLAALGTIAVTKGIDVMIGSIIPGAILLCLLGLTKVFSKAVKHAIPPFVGGLVIMIVGVSLSPTAIGGVFSANGSLPANIISGCVTIVVLVICMVFEYRTRNRLISMLSVVIAAVAGCIAAGCTGALDFSGVAGASWFALPEVFHFGVPKFDPSAIAIMTFLYLLVLVETTGTWITISDITGAKLTPKRYDRAVLGDGIACLIASFFGGTPQTGYSSSAGVISLTTVASRQAVMAAGIFLILLGLCPKIMAVIASIPGSVINGIFLIICQILIANGFKVLSKENIDAKKLMVIGLSVAAAVGSMSISADALAGLPEVVQYYFGSGTAVGASIAVILNLILPNSIGKNDKKTEASDASDTGIVDNNGGNQ
jgi:NCS2 family nucleobase:cation symporter-2